MKKHLIVLTVAIILILNLNAQEIEQIPNYKHSFSVHAGGPLALVSFEYEYKFFSNNDHSLYASIGAATAIIAYTFPVGINYSYGGKNKLLLGAHLVLANSYNFMAEPGEEDWVKGHLFAFKIGYEREVIVSRGSLGFSICFLPLFDNSSLFPWGSVGISYNFNLK